MGRDDRESGERSISVGDAIVVTTSEGDEQDSVTRVVMTSTEKGVWLVETVLHGRVIVLAGRHHVVTDGVVTAYSLGALHHRPMIGRLSDDRF